MAKVKRPPNNIPTVSTKQMAEAPAFVSWSNDTERRKAFAEMGRAINKIEPIQRSVGALASQYKNIDSNTSVRSPFSRLDYEFFRPNEQIPRLQKQIMAACMSAYDKVGIIRNIIDLMGDFASQGIRLVHKDKGVEKFYRSWFKSINGHEVSERFLNHLYRVGNVLIQRDTAKLKKKNVEEFRRGIAEVSIDMNEEFEPTKSEVPHRYTFINPLMVDVVGEELTGLTGKTFYKIKLPQRVISMIQNPRDEFELGMVSSIPDDIVDAVNGGSKELKLGEDKLLVYHYKKDDWQVWANPMTYAILDDLITLEKMKMADLAALDGAISHIRIWKLGNLEHKLLPTDAAINKLADLLLNNVGGGAMDLIWGPDLEVDETSTDIHKFLGNQKYDTVLTSIYAGLGVPPTLTGTGTNGGFTNNFISLRTLIERLRYGRSILNSFWEAEIKIVQKAMGFRSPAKVIYDNMNLSDEASEKALWIRLAEECIISDETVQEKFGQIPEIERSRLNREYNLRQSGKLPPKVSPYHDPQPELSLEKIFAQRGAVTPGQLGIELEDKGPDELTALDIQKETIKQKQNEKTGVSGEGRPLNSKDKEKRKQRTVLPRSKASLDELGNLTFWASSAQAKISEIVNPFFLEKFEKTNLRKFTEAEFEEMENFKYVILANLEPHSEVTQESIYEKITAGDLAVYELYDHMLNKFKGNFVNVRGFEPTLEDVNRMKAFIYSLINIEGDDDGEDSM